MASGKYQKDYKREILRAARELLYPKSVIEAIKNAGSEEEVIRITTNARNSYIDKLYSKS